MQEIKTYTITELAREKWWSWERVKRHIDKWEFIPVKIETAQMRMNPKGYWVRYIQKKEVLDYIEDKKEELGKQKEKKKLERKNKKSLEKSE